MTEPYREAAEVDEDEDEDEDEDVDETTSHVTVKFIGGGKLLHKKHKCSPPGFWACLWNGVEEDDIWCCPCGQRFTRLSAVTGFWHKDLFQDEDDE